MKRLVTAGAMAFLSACGSGGGGTNTPMITTVPFSSFSAIQANQAVTFSGGMSEVVTGTISGTAVTPGIINLDTTSTTGTLTYGTNRALSAVSVVTPSASISFSRTGAGNSFNCTSGVCGLTSTNATAIVIDPTTSPLGWNYQTFGVWNRATSLTSFDAGVFSFGSPTPATALPTTGTATFNGLANGFFVDSTHTAFFTTAQMTANVIWSTTAPTITFSTTNTTVVGITAPSSIGTSNSGLNLNAAIAYPAGTNAFSGTVTSNNGMTGTLTGRYFGPNAEEVGGLYNLSNPAVGTMMGGFGGKR